MADWPPRQPLATAVADRVQRLERDGVITGYHRDVDPKAIGYPLRGGRPGPPASRQLHKIPEVARESRRSSSVSASPARTASS